jgi:L-aminopeptidase/D-esterase-like protein
MLNTFKIGHQTDLDRATGCTVIIPPEQNVASAAARGASPGSREYALLSPKRKIERISALVLTGGSAFGLNCAHGVMETMAAEGKGYQTNFGMVPIVPAAVIFDKNIGSSDAFPSAEDAVLAYQSARFNNDQSGNVGVGTGATVGKWRGMDHAMKGGLGIATVEHMGIKVTAVTVVNAVGDILDYDGSILAGAYNEQGFLAEGNPYIHWDELQIGLAENTVLSAVLTNAQITKQQAHFLAERAHHGIARRVEPSHTGYDGDICFVISSAQVPASLDLTAGLVVHAVEESIINGVKQASTLHQIKGLHKV